MRFFQRSHNHTYFIKGYAICKLHKTINEKISEYFQIQGGGPFRLCPFVFFLSLQEKKGKISREKGDRFPPIDENNAPLINCMVRNIMTHDKYQFFHLLLNYENSIKIEFVSHIKSIFLQEFAKFAKNKNIVFTYIRENKGQ